LTCLAPTRPPYTRARRLKRLRQNDAERDEPVAVSHALRGDGVAGEHIRDAQWDLAESAARLRGPAGAHEDLEFRQTREVNAVARDRGLLGRRAPRAHFLDDDRVAQTIDADDPS